MLTTKQTKESRKNITINKRTSLNNKESSINTSRIQVHKNTISLSTINPKTIVVGGINARIMEEKPKGVKRVGRESFVPWEQSIGTSRPIHMYTICEQCSLVFNFTQRS